ncbi:MAG: hypothetical protein VX210_10575 [Myxococcota bacterium]|nr:hypothetical protein [Myxococcota bacterium]
MVWNVSVRCICFAFIMIGASTVSAKTLYLDEVEVKAELPKEPYDSFFQSADLVDKRWLPRELATVERERLASFRARTEEMMNGCLPSYRCSISVTDLTTAQTWIDTLKPSDDPRARLQVGLLRGWWIVGTYSRDLLRQSQAQKPTLDVEDALRYLRAQFVRADEPLMQAGFLYAQAKVALWAQDIDRAIEALMFVERIEESVLTSEIFAWLGALEEARGRLDTARTYYSRVRHGAYLAPSLLGIARVSRHLGACAETLKVGARFQTRVASSEERQRYLDALIREEALCEAMVVGGEMVERLDGINAPAVHKAAKALSKERTQQSAQQIFMDDLVACFNIQFPDYFRSEPLDLSVAGTASDLELSPVSDSVLYGSNVIGELEACMQRRLASGFADWRIEGEIRILPSR